MALGNSWTPLNIPLTNSYHNVINRIVKAEIYSADKKLYIDQSIVYCIYDLQKRNLFHSHSQADQVTKKACN